jgi:predicted secreted protein
MAQTVGLQNGTLSTLTIGGTAFTHETESSLEYTQDLIEVTNKSSGGWAAFLPGKRGATISLSGLWADDATQGHTQLETQITGRTSATYRYSTTATGDHYVEITGYVTSLSRSAGTESEHSYSASFTASGAIVVGTVS